MANVSVGKIIEAVDYNTLATTYNKLFSDNYSTVQYPAAFSGTTLNNASTSNAILTLHENDYPSSPGTGPFTLSPAPTSGDFIVVQIGNEVQILGHTIDYTAGTITFTSALPAATRVVVYNRTTHRFGWGNAAAVNNHAVGDIIEAVDINQLINRTNIMMQHVGSNTRYTIVPVGTIIYASGLNNLETTLDNEMFANDQHLTVDDASVIAGPTFTRTANWTTQLEGIFSYTFSSYNEARYFFNSGGEVRWSLNATGNTSNDGYLSWRSVFNRLGTLRMNHNNTLQSGTGGISNAKGFYHLTTDWQNIFTSAGPGSGGGYGYGYGYGNSYSAVFAQFFAKYVELGNGNWQVQIRVLLDDSQYHTTVIGTTEFASSTLHPDNITQNNVNYSVTGPVIAVVENFNSGNDS